MKKSNRSKTAKKPAKSPAPAGRKHAAAKPLSKSEWGPIRRMLVEKRQTILDAMRKNQAAADIPDVGDEADQAGQSIEKELLFELSDNERIQLDQIEGALRKMDKGTFGICEQCRKPIQKLRLKALPFARYCISCQSTAERAASAL